MLFWGYSSFFFSCPATHVFFWRKILRIRLEVGEGSSDVIPRFSMKRQDNVSKQHETGFFSLTEGQVLQLSFNHASYGMAAQRTLPSNINEPMEESCLYTQKPWLLLLKFLCKKPCEILIPDPFVELITITNGNLDLCRLMAYGRAALVSVPSFQPVAYLHLYELDLWIEILGLLVHDVPAERSLFVSVLFDTGLLVSWELRSIHYAYEYWNQEDLWFRALGLGKYNSIWKETQQWKEHHRSRNQVSSLGYFQQVFRGD